jgi:membrane-associated protein
LFLVSICAIAGDQLGYYIGRKTGPLLFRKEDSRFFKKAHLQRAHGFYEKYGSKTIVLARFVPIVRTFAPVVAGAANMNYRKFTTYNIMGGILWVCGIILAGYALGSLIPNLEQYLHIIVLVIIGLSVLPIVIEYIRHRKETKHTTKRSKHR